MSAKRRQTARDTRRRTYGQNFLVDTREINRLIERVGVQPGQLIVEIGAGRGALTIPLARGGAEVIAVEADRVWADRLHHRVESLGLAGRVQVVSADFRSIRLPDDEFRVVSNPPFGLTTSLFDFLLDHPAAGPWRADLLLQYEVARKRARTPATSLRSAAWAPWWDFELGPRVPAQAFRPIPRADAAMLVVRRRDPGLLPEWLAPQFRELLRPGWHPPVDRQVSRRRAAGKGTA